MWRSWMRIQTSLLLLCIKRYMFTLQPGGPDIFYVKSLSIGQRSHARVIDNSLLCRLLAVKKRTGWTEIRGCGGGEWRHELSGVCSRSLCHLPAALSPNASTWRPHGAQRFQGLEAVLLIQYRQKRHFVGEE